MIKPMFGHRPKVKKFNFQFQHYDPKKDERQKQRIKIKRGHKKYHQGRSVFLYALGLSLVVYIIYLL